MTVPGVTSVALNTSNPERVKENVEMVNTQIPDIFWKDMKENGLIDKNFPYAG
jgi:D-threo-aldose 1-dehydrogenase